MCVNVFFFKQKPEYELRISDWSSDVCSSDLLVLADTGALETLSSRELMAGYAEVVKYGLINDRPFFDWLEVNLDAIKSGDVAARTHAIVRTEERRVGKEWGSRGRSRWWQLNEDKNIIT